VYLCSDEAANVSGRTIGASGYRVSLYSDMEIEREIYNDGPWDVDRLFDLAPKSIFKGLEPPSGDLLRTGA